MSENNVSRCAWCGNDPLYQSYHDSEWGIPLYDSHRLFELLVLESFQAGLSWITVLRKRENFRAAFHGFSALKIARFSSSDIEDLLQNAGIIRHRGKITATIANAQAFLAIEDKKQGGFSDMIWDTVEGKPKINHWQDLSEIPSVTDQSKALSNSLQKQGFRFVGPTTCYAFMQAAGLVDDHEIGCFRRAENSMPT